MAVRPPGGTGLNAAQAGALAELRGVLSKTATRFLESEGTSSTFGEQDVLTLFIDHTRRQQGDEAGMRLLAYFPPGRYAIRTAGVSSSGPSGTRR